MVSTERPRLSVRPLSDSRFESLKFLLGIDDEMKQVMQGFSHYTATRQPLVGGDRADGGSVQQIRSPRNSLV